MNERDEKKLMDALVEALGPSPLQNFEAYHPQTKTRTIVISNKRALLMVRWGILKGWIK